MVDGAYHITLFITVLIDQPWLYFVFEIVVLNTILIYMCRRHEKFCRHFAIQIREGKY